MSEPTNFDALIAEIDGLAKAMPTRDEAKIAAAAGVDPAAAGGDAPAVEAPASEDEPGMAKSFKVTLEDGTEVDAMDGAALVKALTDRTERLEGNLAKALTSLTTLVKSQGEELAKLRTSAAPRKTVLTITEKPAATLAKSEPANISTDEFMAKAMTAFTAGKITGRDVAIAEQSINAGQQPPADLIRTILA